jgi:hypothetical protein
VQDVHVPPLEEFFNPTLVFAATNEVDDAKIKCSIIEKAVYFRPLIPRTDCKASLDYNDSEKMPDHAIKNELTCTQPYAICSASTDTMSWSAALQERVARESSPKAVEGPVNI